MLDKNTARWLSDSDFGLELQDFDLVLADRTLLPQLRTYLDNVRSVEEKKLVVISALLVLLEDEKVSEAKTGTSINAEIQQVLRKHSEIAQKALNDLGLVHRIVVRKILGLEISSDTPSWVLNRADELVSPK